MSNPLGPDITVTTNQRFVWHGGIYEPGEPFKMDVRTFNVLKRAGFWGKLTEIPAKRIPGILGSYRLA